MVKSAKYCKWKKEENLQFQYFRRWFKIYVCFLKFISFSKITYKAILFVLLARIGVNGEKSIITKGKVITAYDS